MITDTDLAYIAGFFDGEGCVGIYPQQNRLRVDVIFSNSNESVMSWIASTLGTVGPMMEARNNTTHPHYTIRLVGKEAGRVLRILLPYLKVKNARAAFALRVLDLPRLRSRWDTNKEAVLEERAELLSEYSRLKAGERETWS